MTDFNKKDYFYYLDLIAELKRIADIEKITDPEQFERIYIIAKKCKELILEYDVDYVICVENVLQLMKRLKRFH